MSPTAVSIIICTRNRADDLGQTLDALKQVHVPDRLRCELLVVDNGSTDHTVRVVQSITASSLPIQYLMEPQRGKGFAYNAGLAAMHGRIALFTDDDVRPPSNWIADTCAPILEGRAEAVAGGVRIAPPLLRPWMTPKHQALMGSTEFLDAEHPPAMVGANMALSRDVLARIPAFDTELGPGALGFNDETLISLQIKAAGFRLASAFESSVEHHFDPARLTRSSWLERAKTGGRSDAYIARHWEHNSVRMPRLRLLKQIVRLWQRRLMRHPQRTPEGISLWEYDSVSVLHFLLQYLREQRRAPLYERHGLIKCQP